MWLESTTGEATVHNAQEKGTILKTEPVSIDNQLPLKPMFLF